jgi:hypothetical protein
MASHGANGTPLAEDTARIFCSAVISISKRLAACAFNTRSPVLRGIETAPKRLSDSAYADIRARRMRERTGLV